MDQLTVLYYFMLFATASTGLFALASCLQAARRARLYDAVADPENGIGAIYRAIHERLTALENADPDLEAGLAERVTQHARDAVFPATVRAVNELRDQLPRLVEHAVQEHLGRPQPRPPAPAGAQARLLQLEAHAANLDEVVATLQDRLTPLPAARRLLQRLHDSVSAQQLQIQQLREEFDLLRTALGAQFLDMHQDTLATLRILEGRLAGLEDRAPRPDSRSRDPAPAPTASPGSPDPAWFRDVPAYDNPVQELTLGRTTLRPHSRNFTSLDRQLLDAALHEFGSFRVFEAYLLTGGIYSCDAIAGRRRTYRHYLRFGHGDHVYTFQQTNRHPATQFPHMILSHLPEPSSEFSCCHSLAAPPPSSELTNQQ